MSEKFQNDLMHFQNELLGDLKNVENRIETKIKKINQSIDEQKNGLEKKIKLFGKCLYSITSTNPECKSC